MYKNKFTICLKSAFQFLIPIISFILILRIGIPQCISNISNNKPLLLLISILFLYLGSILKKTQTLVILLIILLLFTLPLSYFWVNGITTQKIIGGLIPHRDSMYYYLNARNVLNGKLFDAMTVGRPLFPCFLAFLVWITQDNIQSILIVMAILLAFSFYLLYIQLRMELGAFATSFFISGLYMFYANWIPLLMSEQMGILYSNLGLALILDGIRKNKKKTIFLGILMITLALNARVGAMFVILALIFFMGLAYKKKKKFAISNFAWALGAVIFGFLINTFVFFLLSNHSVMPYSSFAYALYGQSKGGMGWTSIQKDFPGLSDSYKILHFALFNIKRNPLGFIIGSLKAYRDFFLPGINNSFVFLMGYGNSLFVYISWLVVCFFSVYALFHSFLNLKNKLNIFIILMFIGILISVPFAPPIDSESMRTYAATIPVVMLLPSMGIAKLLKNINFYNKSKFTINQELNQYLMIIFSSIMVSLIILIPIYIKILNKPFILQVNQCTGQNIPILFKLNYGSYVTITPDDTMCGDTPNLCLSKFINNGSVGLVEIYQIIVDSIKNSKTPIIFTAVNDLITGHYYHLLIQKKDFHNLLEHNLVVSGCLHEIDKKEFLYSADSLIINIIN